TNYAIGPMQMVAHSRQPEFQPALSPDGRFVVYGVERGNDLFSDTDLYMRNVQGGDETRLTTTTGFNEAAPAFSPTGDRLAFARLPRHAAHPPGAACQIIVRSFPSGLDREVGACDGAGPNRLSWTADGRSLVYSDSSSQTGDETTEIRALDLETGQRRVL